MKKELIQSIKVLSSNPSFWNLKEYWELLRLGNHQTSIQSKLMNARSNFKSLQWFSLILTCIQCIQNIIKSDLCMALLRWLLSPENLSDSLPTMNSNQTLFNLSDQTVKTKLKEKSLKSKLRKNLTNWKFNLIQGLLWPRVRWMGSPLGAFRCQFQIWG